MSEHTFPLPPKDGFPLHARCPACELPMLLRSDGWCRNPSCEGFAPHLTTPTSPGGSNE
jgi:hypothetical protein